jgi:glycosyltransferase involved in cell wall biosynthesis
MLKIEGIISSVGYGDFLAETIKYNVSVFDRIIVVTSDSDEETREVCRKYSIECLLSNEHNLEGDKFNKGRLVERALQHLSAEGWRVHMDADIVLPSKTRHLLEVAQLNPDFIYGADRIMVKSYEDWQKLKDSGWLGHDYHNRITLPKGYQIGTRWADIHTGGYCPIGYLQIWNSRSDLWRGSRIKTYPTKHNDACRSDVQFALKWDRSCRALIPELFVVHLESQEAKLGANWAGRTTKRWTPNVVGSTGYVSSS